MNPFDLPPPPNKGKSTNPFDYPQSAGSSTASYNVGKSKSPSSPGLEKFRSPRPVSRKLRSTPMPAPVETPSSQYPLHIEKQIQDADAGYRHSDGGSSPSGYIGSPSNNIGAPPSSPSHQRRSRRPSTSSCSSDGSRIDVRELAMKYKALYTEYAKLKKENSMLKRTILKDQEISAAINKSLKSKLKESDLMRDKMEALEFNNNRLTKRLEVLQQSLEENNESHSSSWFGLAGESEELKKAKNQIKLLVEELQRKNEENAKIITHMEEEKEDHQELVKLLETKTKRLKKEVDTTKLEMKNTQVQLNDQMEKQNQENLSLASQVKTLENEKSSVVTSLKLVEIEIDQLKDSYHIEIDHFHDAMERNVLFDDKSNAKYNVLNVISSKSIEDDSSIEELMTGLHILNEWCEYIKEEASSWYQRCVALNAVKEGTLDVRALTEKLSNLYNEYPGKVDDIYNCIERVVLENTHNDKENFVDILSDWLNFNNLLITYHIQRLGEESKQRNCVKSKQLLNRELEEYLQAYQSAVEKFVLGLTVFIDEETSSLSDKLVMLKHMEGNFQNYCNTYSDFLNLVDAKVNGENTDALASDRVIEVNRKLMQLHDTCGPKLANLSNWISEYIKNFSLPRSIISRGVSLDLSRVDYTSMAKMQTSCASYLNFCNSLPEGKVISYNEQQVMAKELVVKEDMLAKLREKISALEGTLVEIGGKSSSLEVMLTETRDLLASKQASLNSTLAELSLERARVKDKSRLVVVEDEQNDEGIVNDKEKERLLGTEDGSTGGEEEESSVTEVKTQERVGQHVSSLIVLSQDGNESKSLGFTPSDIEREKQLQEYYEQKHFHLVEKMKALDNLTVDLSQRRASLERDLAEVTKQRDEYHSLLANATKKFSVSSEALESTRDNYETQLSVLSEHVVELNTKLSQAKEELSEVLEFRVRCGKCKMWNTIRWLIEHGKRGRYCSAGNHPSSLNFA